jgi:hypothetical protein
MAQGQREQCIEIRGRDEVASLAREFNLMCHQLQESHARFLDEQQEKLARAELRHWNDWPGGAVAGLARNRHPLASSAGDPNTSCVGPEARGAQR